MRRITIITLLVGWVSACGADGPADSLETSVQAVSVSPTTTVYPTPSTNPSSDADAVHEWCSRLASADAPDTIPVYRDARHLDEPALIEATEVLADQGATEEEAIRAGEAVERICGDHGIDLSFDG